MHAILNSAPFCHKPLRVWPRSWRGQQRRPVTVYSAERPIESFERRFNKEEERAETKPQKKTNRGLLTTTLVSPSAGTIALCCLNAVLFCLDRVAPSLQWIPHLYLFHANPQWWQFVTSAFCHASWEHLSSNLFLLYVFGKLVEEEEGAFGVWATYLICALGGNLAALWSYPSSAISLGASAAVFGLFVVSVMIRLSWNLKRLLEVGILGQFVVKQVMNEVNLHLQGGTLNAAGQVGHVAHLGGALMGVMLILLLRQLPEPEKKG